MLAEIIKENSFILQIDCDKSILVTLKHDDKLQDGSECAFQVLVKRFILSQVFKILLCLILLMKPLFCADMITNPSIYSSVCPSLHHCFWSTENSSYNFVSAMHKYA